MILVHSVVYMYGVRCSAES